LRVRPGSFWGSPARPGLFFCPPPPRTAPSPWAVAGAPVYEELGMGGRSASTRPGACCAVEEREGFCFFFSESLGIPKSRHPSDPWPRNEAPLSGEFWAWARRRQLSRDPTVSPPQVEVENRLDSLIGRWNFCDPSGETMAVGTPASQRCPYGLPGPAAAHPFVKKSRVGRWGPRSRRTPSEPTWPPPPYSDDPVSPPPPVFCPPHAP